MPLPRDLRNATWADVLTHVGADLRRVHTAWRDHGPGTTREIAERSGISLLTLRPRTTELYQLGLVECISTRGSAGVYAYRSEAEAEARQAWREDRSSHTQSGRAKPDASAALDHMTQAQQVRWAAGVLSRHGQHKRRVRSTATEQQMNLISA